MLKKFGACVDVRAYSDPDRPGVVIRAFVVASLVRSTDLGS
jgi:hypothetical protein